MMNWPNGFELMCYVIVAIMLADLIHKKDYNSLFTFGAAALVGFTMELLAVSVTDIYYYNPGFYLNIGTEPNQFPLFGGFMWGGLTVYGIKLAQKLNFNKWMTALAAGMMIVTLDLLLDVVAIRLDGGFWAWAGNPIETTINRHTFFSVIWVNYLGYLIETPAVVLLTLIKNEKVRETDFGKQALSMVLIALGAICITSTESLIALGLNRLTDDWFTCGAFILLWLLLAAQIIRQSIGQKLRLAPAREWNIPMAIFWNAMYIFCIAAIAALNLHQGVPLLMIAGFLFYLYTLYLSLSKSNLPA